MNIIPNSVVKVLRNVPLDNTFNDTILFNTTAAQTAYFNSKVKYAFNNVSVQRVNSTVTSDKPVCSFRCDRVSDDMYDCNYLMFQNTNFGSKWFYAFIKSVNYISPSTSEIIYEIDDFQTWFLNCAMKPSFVEREHVADDSVFSHYDEEPVAPSKYYMWRRQWISPDMIFPSAEWYDKSPFIIVPFADIAETNVLSSIISIINVMIAQGQDIKWMYTYGDEDQPWVAGGFNPNYNQPTYHADGNVALFRPSMHGGLFSGFYLFVVPAADYWIVQRLFWQITQKDAIAAGYSKVLDSIPALYFSSICPLPTVSDIGQADRPTSYDYTSIYTLDVPTFVYTTPHLGTYTIKNKKLLNSPFCKIQIASGSGSTISLEPEMCKRTDDNKLKATIYYTQTETPEMLFLPAYYGVEEDFTNSVSFKESNTLNWSKDVGSIWAANNAQTHFLSQLAGGISLLNNAKNLNLSGVSDSLIGLLSSSAAFNQKANVADTPVSGSAASIFQTVLKRAGFEVRYYIPAYDDVVQLDNFFDMYGYTIRKLKQPLLNSRPYWNYVKLSEPCIIGSIPVDSMNKIKAIFANGVRLWHDGDVGNYNRDNSPGGGN